MIMSNRRRFIAPWLSLSFLLGSVYACGSSESNGGTAGPGASCTKDSECTTGECLSGKCAVASSNTGGTSSGASGTNSATGGDAATSSGGTSSSSGGTTASSTGGSNRGGTSSTSGSAGVSTGGAPIQGSGGSGTTTTPGPHFSGSGQSFRPLTTGCGPDTADACTGSCEQGGGDPDVTVIRSPATLCFKGDGDNTPDDPSAVIEQVIERVGGVSYVHIRVTFDPSFTDNTFGEGACCGWPTRRGHSFTDLVKSDHTELLLTNTQGETVMNFKIDLISADATADCGYGTLGVRGGDGSVIVGNADDVLAVSTSLDRNLNGCGYCKNAACASSGDCTVDSPPTDENYTPNAETPNWDYRQVYEVWIALDAFGGSGFGQAFITYTHSSPAKASTDTITVTPTPCPPDWDRPYCPPSVIQEGGNCFGSGGSGGMGGSGGTGAGGTSTGGTGGGVGGSGTGGTSSGGTGGTGGTGPCPPNYQVYITTEGASLCTPIPFANYDGMKPCPAGYTLDIASEGQYCVPAP